MPLSIIYKSFLYLYSESVMFSSKLYKWNRSVNGF